MLVIGSDLFTYDAVPQCFTADASELENELARQGWRRLRLLVLND
jgi:hypothetical protein